MPPFNGIKEQPTVTRNMSSAMRRFFVACVVWLIAGEQASSGKNYINPLTLPQHEVLCFQVDDHRLAVGASCVASIKAESSENTVGLHLQRSEEYIVTVAEDQVWHDGSYEHIPPKGNSGTLLMSLFAFLKKHRDAEWFALIGEIKGAYKCHLHDLSKSSNLLAEEDGLLILYANDARGFYWNNRGKVTVIISRKK